MRFSQPQSGCENYNDILFRKWEPIEELKIRSASEEDMPEIMKLIGQPDMSPDNRLTSDEVSKLFKTITSTPFHRLYVVETEN